MNGQELIQVSFQLPPDALDSLSRLVEQLRKLTTALQGPGQSAGTQEEITESGSFDQERFQELLQKSGAAAAQISGAEAQVTRPSVATAVPEAVRAGQEVQEGPEEPCQAAPPSDDAGEAPDAASRDPARNARKEGEDIPAVRPEMNDQAPDAPVVRMEPETTIPDAEQGWMGTEEQLPPLPTAREGDAAGIETPVGAGTVITAQPEPPASRWTDVTEELVTPGPAPLTAEAVSLAFQRDGRRYDNGFPLY